VEIWYNARALSLLQRDDAVTGVKVKVGRSVKNVMAPAVVLACGGFEANPEWRARYLGPGWESVKVRGSRFNTGDGLRMALEIGAASFGNWSGCHSAGCDSNASEFGNQITLGTTARHSFRFGIMINARGLRFVDEGADFQNYTYAKYGRVILAQPGQFAWQIFDHKVASRLPGVYRQREVTKVVASSLEELAAKLDGVDGERFLEEVQAYNKSIQTDAPFDPSVKDGRATVGLTVQKSNWALPIDTPPFEAYQVGCHITFTFGGLRIVPNTAQVLDVDLIPIPGLFAAGEMVGGVFHGNYPGGAGLMSGATFGRMAGASAARLAMASRAGSCAA
jgi:tricarballylate dehydrogenase